MGAGASIFVHGYREMSRGNDIFLFLILVKLELSN